MYRIILALLLITAGSIPVFADTPLTLPAEDAHSLPAYTIASQPGTQPSGNYSGIPQQQSPVMADPDAFEGTTDNGNLEIHTGVTFGDPNAPVTMHIFTDFQCHFCKSFHEEVLPLIIEDFVRNGQVKLVFHDFPRLGTDPSLADLDDMSVEINDPNNESALAAHAAMCAGEQGRYMEMSDGLFASLEGVQQGTFSRANLNQLAEAEGLKMEAFHECMGSGRYFAALVFSVEQGRDNGIAATPMFILDNGSGELTWMQQTSEGYPLLKEGIETSVATAP